MTLSEKQQKFARMLGLLLHHVATRHGYEVTIGEVHRTKAMAEKMAEEGKGISNSLHILKLAADLHLFIGGTYQTSTEAHKPLGKFWKSMGGSWGGDFGDGNHYSLKHNGVR